MSDVPCERRIGARGLAFRALEWPGAAPAALLLHATSFCADAWRPVWEAARASELRPRRAVAVDQRGHGGSEAPATAAAYAWTELAEDAAALADALGAPLLAIGHSSGATALLAVAGMRPAAFAAVVAVEPVLFEPGDSFAASPALAAAARRRRDRFASRDEARARLRPRFPYSGFASEAFEAYLDGALEPTPEGVVLRCPGEREAWCYEGAAALDLWPLAARIAVPLLLVLGEQSAVPPTLRDRLLGERPAARVTTIAGATHFAALERPAEVGRAVAGFASEVLR
jgi:lipase